jgi:hypothetical protein
MSLLALVLPVAMAGVSRHALVVGQNDGARDAIPLLFAEDDARKMHDVLVRLGDVPDDQARLLLAPNRNQLLRALAELRADVAATAAQGDDTLVLVYYSGHADAKRLQLGGSWLTWEELRSLVDLTGADVQLAIVDACQSGQLTRAKGGTRGPSFAVELDAPLAAEGRVLISSSSAGEASHESDAIGGSYFTHFLVSALSGAGDADRDGRVTLTEAWRFVHRETVFETRGARGGAQHPTYAWDLAGTGAVVLTELGASAATLHFPTELLGSFAVYDADQRTFRAEVSLDGGAPVRLALGPGRYQVQHRRPAHLDVAELELADGEAYTLDGDAFSAVAYADDVAKGAIEKRARAARRPDLSLHIAAGVRGFADAGITDAYLPDTLGTGLAARWRWSGGAWVGADALGGRNTSRVEIAGTTLALESRGTTLGVAGGMGTRRRLLSVAGGGRLAGVWLSREFDEPGVSPQSLFTLTPGIVARAGVHPGPVDIELELRAHHLPYTIDDYDQGLSFSEALLTIGVQLP